MKGIKLTLIKSGVACAAFVTAFTVWNVKHTNLTTKLENTVDNEITSVSADTTKRYKVEVDIGGSGSVKQSAVEVEPGKTVTVSFIPNPGFKLTKVTVNGVDRTSEVKNNQITITVNSDIKVYGLTEKEQTTPATKYKINITASGAGNYGTTSDKNNEIEAGKPLTLTFSPAEGHKLTQLTINGVDKTAEVKDNKFTMIVNSNLDINIVLGKDESVKTYKATINGSGHGRVALSAENVLPGKTVTATFTPYEGYKLTKVTVNGVDRTSEVVDNKLTITVNSDVDFFGVMEKEESTTTKYKATVTAEGQGKWAIDASEVEAGKTVTATFTPAEGYKVTKVTVNGADRTSELKDNKLTITVNEDVAIHAVMEKISTGKKYKVDINGSGAGRVGVSAQEAEAGEKVTAIFEPSDGWKVTKVTVNGVDKTSEVKDNKLVVTISGDTQIYATMEKEQTTPVTKYKVNISGEGGGKVGVSAQEVEAGKTVTATFTPNEGYKVTKVTVNGVDRTSEVKDNKLIIVVNSDTNIYAEMYKDEVVTPPVTKYKVNISADGGSGSVSANAKEVEAGKTVTITCKPDNGYKVGKITVNGTDRISEAKDNKLTITVNSDVQVKVTFAETTTPTKPDDHKTSTGWLKGDLDRDGVVNANDAAVALKLYNYGGVTSDDLIIGDMDNDGIINANDAALILKIYNYGY